MKTIHKVFIVVLLSGILGHFIIFSGLPDKEAILQYKVESTINDFLNFQSYNNSPVPIRKNVKLRQISLHLRTAVIVSEDDVFFQHSGVNVNQIWLAIKESVQKKRFARGASTITMQVARNAFLTKEKSLIRKLREIISARRIEKVLTKTRILELYLNIVEWGPNIYGAEAASWYYFNQPASDLDLAQASLLAAILPNPIRFNPYKRFNLARKLQYRVLRLMRNSKVITAEEMDFIYSQQIVLREQY